MPPPRRGAKADSGELDRPRLRARSPEVAPADPRARPDLRRSWAPAFTRGPACRGRWSHHPRSTWRSVGSRQRPRPVP